MLKAEQDVQDRLGDRPVDFEANRAISNIYRAAAAVRRKAERGALKEQGLSWGGFTILWVLWIWGETETATLAAECDLAKGTLTGMLTTLEKRDLVSRERSTVDRRRVLVQATPAGVEMIEQLFPSFNQFEAEVTSTLTDAESVELSRLLRKVITNASSD